MRRITILVAATAACLRALCGCESAASTHVYVVPDGYCGAFVIVEDKVDGEVILPIEGTITYEIPSSGILRVKDASYMSAWHGMQMRFADGNVIPDGESASRGEVAAYSIGSSDSIYHWFVVGTRQQADERLGAERIRKILRAHNGS